MTSSNHRARDFAGLHVPGQPLMLYNIWDAGSARAVAGAGARAIATGSASVAEANGMADGEEVPIELALANAKRIVDAVDLPVTVDFEGAYAEDAQGVERNIGLLAATGAVGCNLEDQVVRGEGLYPIPVQAARVAAARRAGGADFFINARTDIFLKAPAETHDTAMVEHALERARAYADAGASGFFVPRLADLSLLERVCRECPLPVNFMAFPGCPTNEEVAAVGVARISHGPFPYRALMNQLAAAARAQMA
jgi:2-methylisocitrate lyase-like PEP mutase family enzyme